MYRKIEDFIKKYIDNDDNHILFIYGARQIGKTYIIHKVASNAFKNYIEINFDEDNRNDQLFKDVKTIDDFYIQLSTKYGRQLKNREDTIIFIDEIQVYPQFFSMLKQLNIDNKYRYICSGSELGINLKNNEGLTPMGSIIEKKMYPMDFEEFLLANGCGDAAINYLKDCFVNKQTVEESTHNYIMDLFLKYLIVGGLPECVKTFVESKNIAIIKDIQSQTYKYYSNDASKYDNENKLKIKRIYDLMLSCIDSNVKRIQISKINNNSRDTYSKYLDEFDYLISSGIALDSKAISQPKFPLVQSSEKRLIKLYFNDVGLLSEKLYKTNINAILKEKTGINLGAVYETVVAQELKAHGHDLYYYDRRSIGEVDFLVDDYNNLCVLPIEVKLGKDSYIYRALPKLVHSKEYRIKEGYVLSNKREVTIIDNIVQLPIYDIMFI